MAIRRHTDPVYLQYIWDALEVPLLGKEYTFDHILNFIKQEKDLKCTLPRLHHELSNAIKDGCINVTETRYAKADISQLAAKRRHDWYCFECHAPGLVYGCPTCFRVYHDKCLGSAYESHVFPRLPDEESVENAAKSDASFQKDYLNKMVAKASDREPCPACERISGAIRRPSTTKMDLHHIFLTALERMRSKNPWRTLHTVGYMNEPHRNAYFACKPINTRIIADKFKAEPGSPEGYSSRTELLIDLDILVHNTAIVYGSKADMVNTARQIRTQLQREMRESALCIDCYLRSKGGRPDPKSLVKPCRTPHHLLWFQHNGWSFRPCKVLYENKEAYEVVCFDGRRERECVPRQRAVDMNFTANELGLRMTPSLKRALDEANEYKSNQEKVLKGTDSLSCPQTGIRISVSNSSGSCRTSHSLTPQSEAADSTVTSNGHSFHRSDSALKAVSSDPLFSSTTLNNKVTTKRHSDGKSGSTVSAKKVAKSENSNSDIPSVPSDSSSKRIKLPVAQRHRLVTSPSHSDDTSASSSCSSDSLSHSSAGFSVATIEKTSTISVPSTASNAGSQRVKPLTIRHVAGSASSRASSVTSSHHYSNTPPTKLKVMHLSQLKSDSKNRRSLWISSSELSSASSNRSSGSTTVPATASPASYTIDASIHPSKSASTGRLNQTTTKSYIDEVSMYTSAGHGDESDRESVSSLSSESHSSVSSFSSSLSNSSTFDSAHSPNHKRRMLAPSKPSGGKVFLTTAPTKRLSEATKLPGLSPATTFNISPSSQRDAKMHETVNTSNFPIYAVDSDAKSFQMRSPAKCPNSAHASTAQSSKTIALFSNADSTSAPKLTGRRSEKALTNIYLGKCSSKKAGSSTDLHYTKSRGSSIGMGSSSLFSATSSASSSVSPTALSSSSGIDSSLGDPKSVDTSPGDLTALNGTVSLASLSQSFPHDVNPTRRKEDRVQRFYMEKLQQVTAERDDARRETCRLVSLLYNTQQQHEEELRQCKQSRWCHICLRKALYHCCAGVAYCSQECQLKHWTAEHSCTCLRRSESSRSGPATLPASSY